MKSDICGLIKLLYIRTQLRQTARWMRGSISTTSPPFTVWQHSFSIINNHLSLIVKHFSEEPLHTHYFITLFGNELPYYHQLWWCPKINANWNTSYKTMSAQIYPAPPRSGNLLIQKSLLTIDEWMCVILKEFHSYKLSDNDLTATSSPIDKILAYLSFCISLAHPFDFSVDKLCSHQPFCQPQHTAVCWRK